MNMLKMISWYSVQNQLVFVPWTVSNLWCEHWYYLEMQKKTSDVGMFPIREIWISRAEISFRVAVHPFGSCFNAVDIIKALEVSQHLMPPLPLCTFAWERPCDGGATMFFFETKLKRTPKVFCIEIICQ